MLGKNFWSKYFKVYDVLNFCIPYQELKNDLVSALKIKPGEFVLDAGGGTGNIAVELSNKGAGVTVFDFSKEALRICKEKDEKINVVSGDLTQKLPFPDNYFDKIVSNNTIYTIKPSKRNQVIKEIYRTLKPKGIFVVSNIRIGFEPLKIYKEHIKKSLKNIGFLNTSKAIINMTWPTTKMFYYNSLIKKEHTKGTYEFLTTEEQENLLKKSGFCLSSETKIVYGDQGILTIATKQNVN